MSQAAISFNGAQFSFGRVPAITDLTFVAPKEKITVLLGPNGAGKTTAMRLITGALEPTSGSVTVQGVNPSDSDTGNSVRSLIGVVSAKPSLYERATGKENLRYAAELYGVKKADIEERIQEATKRFDINHVLDKRTGEYSTGMKTRLVLARSILHEPEILLYDEPTSGLDPESSKAVLDLIREMTRFGKTVLMCTHLLVEAEDLADQIVVMQQGTVTAEGSKSQLIQQYFSEIQVTIETTSVEHAETVLAVSQKFDAVLGGRSEHTRSIMTVVSENCIPDLVRAVVEEGVPVCAVTPVVPSLEDLYFASQRPADAVGAASVAGAESIQGEETKDAN